MGMLQGCRHLAEGHPEEVVQHDDRPVPLIEPAHGRVDELPIGQRAGQVGRGGHVDGRKLDLDGAPSTAPDLVETGIDGQAMEPGVEPIGVTQPRQVAPGSDEGLLDRVAGQLRIPEDEAGGPVQPRDGPAGELGEGVMIALPRPVHESSLVHGRLGCGMTDVVVLDRVWRRCRRIGFRGHDETPGRWPGVSMLRLSADGLGRRWRRQGVEESDAVEHRLVERVRPLDVLDHERVAVDLGDDDRPRRARRCPSPTSQPTSACSLHWRIMFVSPLSGFVQHGRGTSALPPMSKMTARCPSIVVSRSFAIVEPGVLADERQERIDATLEDLPTHRIVAVVIEPVWVLPDLECGVGLVGGDDAVAAPAEPRALRGG